MRTALAVLCLMLVVILAVAGASYVTGYVRVEFAEDDAPRTPLATPAEEAIPVADAPEAVMPPEVNTPPETSTPAETAESPMPAEPAASAEPPAPAMPAVPAEAPAPAMPAEVAGSAAPEPPPASVLPQEIEAAPDPAVVASAPRIVGGAGITPAPVSREELPREAVPPRPPEPPRWRPFRHVTVVEAGRLDLGKRDVDLAGLAPLAGGQSCRLVAGGPERPCAFLALQALRQRVRALGVECEISVDNKDDPAIAPCRIGKTDLALWLIGQGWATAASGAPPAYGEAEKAARCARRGIWLEAAPPADCPAG